MVALVVLEWTSIGLFALRIACSIALNVLLSKPGEPPPLILIDDVFNKALVILLTAACSPESPLIPNPNPQI